ncbi:bacterial capsule synthesis PGA_cap family protein [Bacteroides fragilis str. S23 R14]|nr:bacterial capsule synthesis PGA_cap family protein [Bacteroides fragilis str. S23 R14]
MQGFEIYNGKHIFYSLGNFVFYMPWEPTKYSLIINVDFEADKIVTTEYVKIGTDSLPRVVSSVPKEYSVEYLNRLIEINEENEKYYAKVTQYYKKYRTVNRRTIIRDFIHMKNRYRIDIIKDFINRKIK